MVNIKIFLGVDHQGFKVKNDIFNYLKSNGMDIICSDLTNDENDDYPDFAYDVCQKVLNENALGILICGSGIGMSIAANKIKGIRCARVFDENDAFTAKNHNGANVIAFSSSLNIEKIYKIIDTFIVTKPPTEERHLRRIDKIKAIEEGYYHEL